MARISRDERIALVLTYQPDRLTREHPLRENLAVIEAGLRPPVRVDLAPLARREIAGLIEGIDGERPSASIVVLVAERSAGSPLVVEELVAARRELKSATLTGSLADLVAARLTRRSPECRRVLRLLAPAERPMDRARLARAAAEIEAQLTRGLPPRSTSLPRRGAGGLEGDLAAGLAEALEHGFVRAEADERLRIRHELVARAVVTDLLPTQRTRYRTALAAAFEDVPVVAAAHWRAAHRLPEAREAALDGRPARAARGGAAGRHGGPRAGPRPDPRRGRRARDPRRSGRHRPRRSRRARRRPRRRRRARRRGRTAGRRGERRRADGRGAHGAGDRPARRGGGVRGDAPDPRRRLRGERAGGAQRAARPDGVRGAPGAARALPGRGRRCRGRDVRPAQGGRRRPARAVDRARPDPRAARAGADDRRRVQRLGAGGRRRRSRSHAAWASPRSPRRSTR